MRQDVRYGLAIALALSLSNPAARGQDARVVESWAAKGRIQDLLKKVEWHDTSIENVLSLAKPVGKLVFWVQLKGRLDAST